MRKTIMKSTQLMPGTVKGSVYMSAFLQRRELRAALRRAREEKKAVVVALDYAEEALGEAIRHLETRHPEATVLAAGWRAAVDEIKSTRQAAGRDGKTRP